MIKLPRLCRGLTTVREAVHQSPQRVAVLHGSHSGNTHRYAKHLASELKWRLNIDAQLRNIAKLDFRDFTELQKHDTLLLLVSTYGSGEPNEASLAFWDQINLAEDANKSASFTYSVLSRGSSLYDSTFAKAGIKFDAKLAALGAHRLTQLGIQDKISPHVHDEYFVWKEGVVQALKNRDNLTERSFVYVPSPRPCRELDDTTAHADYILPGYAEMAELSDVRVSKLQETDRQYVYAEVKVPSDYKYSAGDYVVLWPENRDKIVDKFLAALFGESDRKEKLVEYRGKTTSYKLLAKHFVDIQGQPEREVLLKLAHMAPSPGAESIIREFMNESTEVPSLTSILEAVGEPWCKTLPLPSAIFDLLPHMQPRRYSISSAATESPDYAGLSAVVEHDLNTDFWGTATGQLLRIAESGGTSKMLASFEPLKSFNLPTDPNVPLLLFGIGTGVAPFRGFLRERLVSQQRGKIVLFTGTRSPEDLVHRSEFEELATTKNFDFEIISAFSRSPQSYSPKYIAESLNQNADLIYNLLMKGAHVYVCGDIRKVRRTLRKGIGGLLASRKGLPATETKAQWKALTNAGRTHLELW